MGDSNNSNNSTSGIGFVGLLQISFIVLKLLKVINWSWFLVLTPIWGTTALVILSLLILWLMVK